MKRFATTLALVGFFVCANFAQAEMSSSSFKIRWDAFSTGGSDSSSSASYQLRDSVQSSSLGESTSSSYQGDAGYRAGIIDQAIIFDLYIQNRSAGISATNLSGTTVTADTSGLSVGNYVAIVQNQGASQVTGFGKITSIGASSFVVDRIADNGTAPVIDGSNDYVYPLTASGLSMGELSESAVNTGIIAFETTSDMDNGYTIQVVEDGDFRDGSGNTINDVSDGVVSAGSEEYGLRSSDGSIAGATFDTEDAPITTSFQNVATETTHAFSDRKFITVKASMDASSVAGSYGHTISFIAHGTL